MLEKIGPTTKLHVNNVGSFLYISSASWNESVTVHSFLVKGFNMGAKILL